MVSGRLALGNTPLFAVRVAVYAPSWAAVGVTLIRPDPFGLPVGSVVPAKVKLPAGKVVVKLSAMPPPSRFGQNGAGLVLGKPVVVTLMEAVAPACTYRLV